MDMNVDKSTMTSTISLNDGILIPLVEGRRATKVAVKPLAIMLDINIAYCLNSGANRARSLTLA
jgi:hypothetical protein